MTRRILTGLLAALALSVPAFAQGTNGFTYQGLLTTNGTPANGSYDIRIRLYDLDSGGTPLTSAICFENVAVTNGVFTVIPNFGNQYDSAPRFIELEVRPDSGTACSVNDGYTVLAPRQRLRPAPFAMESLNARFLGDVSPTLYARKDLAETFAEPLTINDTEQLLLNLLSSSTAGAALRINSLNSLRSYDLITTGTGSADGSDNFIIRDSTANATRFSIESTGFVGIGTSNPNRLLDVRDGIFRVATTAAGNGSVFAEVTPDEHGLVGVMNSNGSYYVYIGQSQATNAANVGGQVLVCDSTGLARGGIQINSANSCTVFGQVKSFVESNPDDPTTDIYYACIEGPEAAIYTRGTGQLINGSAIITLPRHFAVMAAAEGITVQITPLSEDCNGIAVVKKSPGAFQVKELRRGTSNAAFDWEVKAVRIGYEDFEVIRPAGLLNTPRAEP